MRGHLYFHSPCFDGIVSAVLTWDFLEARRDWGPLELQPVNYGAREGWLSRSLGADTAVVDFLYHPDAAFWADHHPTTFLTAECERDWRDKLRASGGQEGALFYDAGAPSCASVLWEALFRHFEHRNPAYDELVRWADKIDAARYASVHEALFSEEPAMRIEASLATARGPDCVELVRALRTGSLETVASLASVRERSARARRLMEAGLERFRAGARLMSDGIVVFDVESDEHVRIPRYAPYHFYPDARYSVGIIRGKHGVRLTAMRNPWREFESVPLGKIFEKLGGGGHVRIGSVVLGKEASDAGRRALDRVLSEIRREEQVVSPG